MEKKLQEIRSILKKYGQEHLLNNFENLDDAKKKSLLDEIEGINFELMNSLYEKTKKNKKSGKDEITPIDYLDKFKLGEKYKYYKEIGKRQLKKDN